MYEIGQSDTDHFREELNIYRHEDFYISVGANSDRQNVIAIRWKTFPRNSWCLISKDIDVPFLQSLLQNPNVDKEKLDKVLAEKTRL